MLKLRTGYGRSEILGGMYILLQHLNYRKGEGIVIPFNVHLTVTMEKYTPTRIPTLRWETRSTFNIGFNL